ncbi:hypothetical protein SDRG_10089 [Saprolegnia diclina VS20]|uniref:NAD(+) ADP-ribosyltransferase n=1 Tax=Saprolegnia diclina (strain VS20) TaxID=1156394 RepID=T0RQJ0_SAPDV|nr:hypothetical protein SDRG_10089 [Saprolegnia diclina VS20]EQC32342.1 hypothetical protein SDRG_10089 [Saprolegnia diclina VS20]|eukprot:XP_008614283.1 hypothetical protein SDRG_10089 [Saprolegnia diclina VS20]
MAPKRKAASVAMTPNKKSAPANCGAISPVAVTALAALGITQSALLRAASLALVDVSTNMDKYYELQLLAAGTYHYVFVHWGRTGTAGQTQFLGPQTLDAATADFDAKFLSKTGNAYAPSQPFVRIAGRYDLLAVQEASATGVWEYYVSDGVDGKATAWYPYVDDAIERMELLWQTFQANEGYTQRIVQSGYWSYLIDLVQMTQTNIQTNKKRTIRRSAPILVTPMLTTTTKGSTKRATKGKKTAASKSLHSFSIVSIDGKDLDVNLARIDIAGGRDDFIDLTLIQASGSTYLWTITGSCGERTGETFDGPFDRKDGEARWKAAYYTATGHNFGNGDFVRADGKYDVLTMPDDWVVTEGNLETHVMIPLGTPLQRDVASDLWAWYHHNPHYVKRLMTFDHVVYCLDFEKMTATSVVNPAVAWNIRKMTAIK